MIFEDITLRAGAISSEHVVDTRELSPIAIGLAARMLDELDAGTLSVPHGIAGMPTFTLRRNLPEEWPTAIGNDLFFCVGEPRRPPFQFNVLLRPTTEFGAAAWAIWSLLGLSFGPVPEEALGLWSPGYRAEMQRTLFARRACLLSTVIGMPSDPEIVILAAEFAKCVAAALLLREVER